MNSAAKWIVGAGFVVILMMGVQCAQLQEGLGSLSKIKLTSDDTQAITRTSKALRKSFSDITEEEEYYIGRAVAALILARYPVYRNSVMTKYVNTVGQTVVIASDRPETYAGYHFLVLDTEEINALAAPSGFIFITRGLLKRCRSEEMLASILAHEVGHVCARHGLQSIKKSRLLEAFGVIGEEAVKKYGSEQLAQLTSLFEEALGDIVENLIERGYDRKYEYEADKLSVRFSSAMHYDPHGLLDFLQTMVEDTSGGADKGWFKTHPSPSDRINRIRKAVDSGASAATPADMRTTRFKRIIRTVK